jgi:hypothetical protein
MPKSDYIENNDDLFAAQLQKFKVTIGTYATLLGLTAPQIASQAADADYFAYVQACQQIMLDAAQQWTAWKKLLRTGGTAAAGSQPAPVVFPPAVPAVPVGIEVRFRALVKLLKANPNYNPTIGEALGIEGAVHVPPPAGSFQPVLHLEQRGGLAYASWTFGGNRAFLDSLELQADRGDGKGYVLLAQIPGTHYTDPTPFPATPAKWKYKGIFCKAGVRMGQWSEEASITVG